MFKFKPFLVVLFSLFFVVSCELNDDETNNSPTDHFSENFGNQVSRDFIGQIVDVDNHPIQYATISIGHKFAQTDVNGVFVINNAIVYEQFAFVKASKIGYVDGTRSLVPTTGKNNVKIMLLPNSSTQTIESGESSEVSIYSGTKVVFDGAFQDLNGAPYSGNVQVSLFHLTPSDENISSLMPGMLYAEDKNGQEKVLETFGMLHVQLTGNGGQKLQIASGHTAEISVRIDDSQLGTAPNTIPLWHFDEEKGYWKEEGSATKQGNKYVGRVSHFSWWNCDIPMNSIIATVTVVNELNVPLSNIIVEMVRNDSIDSRLGLSDNNGQISGIIPANEILTMNVYGSCESIIYSTTIGPFSSDTVLPNISISNSVQHSSTVTGLLTDCQNSPVNNGYVLLHYGDNIHGDNTIVSYLDSGNFNFSTLVCENENAFQLEGFDLDNLQITGAINYSFNFPQTEIGTLKACDAVNEFIYWQIDNNVPMQFYSDITAGDVHGFNIVADNIINGTNELFGLGGGFVRSFSPGAYTSSDFALEVWSDSAPTYIVISNTTTNTVVYHVNKFGEVGEYVDMTFEGTFLSGGSTHTVSGTIHVKRDQ